MLGYEVLIDSQVFVISALHHHISILKLRVHDAYLDCLDAIEPGWLPNPLPEDKEWCKPQLSRTKWFDLFIVEDRKEAMKCLFGVLVYQTRNENLREL